METFDAVYFVRHIDGNSVTAERASVELRYSLRSLERNFAGLGSVYVLGGRPRWLNVKEAHWLPGGKPLSSVHVDMLDRWVSVKHLNTWAHWQAIADLARANQLSDRFVIMNDDFFVMHEFDELPNEHRGPVTEWAEARRFGGQRATATTLERTAEWVLEEFGVPVAEQVAYETHGPLTVSAASFGAVMRVAHQHHVRGGKRLAKRSLYGNAVRLPAERAQDFKVHAASDPVDPAARYLSSSDESFTGGTRAGQIARVIGERFSTPCRYEL